MRKRENPYLHILPHPFPRLEPIHPLVLSRLVVQRGVFVHDIDHLQLVTFSELIVVDVVSRRDFESTSAEFAIDVFVADDRNVTPRAKGDTSKTADVLRESGAEIGSIEFKPIRACHASLSRQWKKSHATVNLRL